MTSSSSSSSGDDQPKCPVDHATRDAWLKKAKQSSDATNASTQEYNKESLEILSNEKYNQKSSSSSLSSSWSNYLSGLIWSNQQNINTQTSQSVPKLVVKRSKDESKPVPPDNVLPEGHPPVEIDSDTAECPVSHESRSKWLDLGKQTNESENKLEKINNVPEAIESCSSNNLELSNDLSNVKDFNLPDEREISSIPRTGADSNWIYPSQKQFFSAMKRKDWNPEAGDMKTVVPLHNMVNEIAWKYILMWEKDQGGELCGGIKLSSFKGDSKKITPRARIRNLMGNELPFDRHDWVIDRCGVRVDYVIDFYAKDGASSNSNTNPNANPNANPTFYLDVRPKLNTFEGIRLRIAKAFGF
ncbi:hypothetical protein B5S31_g4866 [[Candida] boidinii]|nr:hypothetical protein B5S31_g4866 [[Candida] boidinii]GME68546.1 unnamed protein product [[Candida] boidinii]